MTQKTVTINGTIYDAHTGLPVGKNSDPKVEKVHISKETSEHQKRSSQSSSAIHRNTQKSKTLNRKTVLKQRTHSLQGITPTTKSSKITRFAPHPVAIKESTQKEEIATTPAPHPAAIRAHQQLSHKKSVQKAPKPAPVIKQEAMSKALHTAPSHAKAGHEQYKTKASTASRRLSLASASLALLLLGGYFTYLNMPNLSVRVAAAQAGIDASYPSYRPDGYRLNGPVAYDQGEVRMSFVANANTANGFVITQKETSWDSSAVKENYANKEWGKDVTQYTEQGLTIYTHENEAAWVNGGILYTITGEAPLSATQIRALATSM